MVALNTDGFKVEIAKLCMVYYENGISDFCAAFEKSLMATPGDVQLNKHDVVLLIAMCRHSALNNSKLPGGA